MTKCLFLGTIPLTASQDVWCCHLVDWSCNYHLN